MKTTAIPAIRIDESFRAEVESVLAEGETISGLTEAALRRAVEYRKIQAAFHQRGQEALDESRRTGVLHAHDAVFAELHAKIEHRRQQLAKPGRTQQGKPR
ncbi:MAG TPA: YlcI/YnfO family protein [Burkholderiaceae bacterium]|nr:YlcI/YnfO family protein [Burkholderiaceae bacterium]